MHFFFRKDALDVWNEEDGKFEEKDIAKIFSTLNSNELKSINIDSDMSLLQVLAHQDEIEVELSHYEFQKKYKNLHSMINMSSLKKLS